MKTIELVSLVILLGFSGCLNDNISPENFGIEMSIQNEYLLEAISSYQKDFILNEAIIDKVVEISPVALYPNLVIEISAIDHNIELLETENYHLTEVNDMPVLIKSFYGNLISAKTDSTALKRTLRSYLANQPSIPRTGYRTDVWYLLLGDSTKQIFNVTDSLEKYEFKEEGLQNLNNLVFPCY